MFSEPGSDIQATLVRMQHLGLEAAERADAIICGSLTNLARAKKLQLDQPVAGVFHRDQLGRDHRYAVWQLSRERGAFLAKVEMMSDEAYTRLYLKVSLQSRFWEPEAQRFGEGLCQATGMHVELERTQSDGIISYSARWDP
jgi:hypothetical protein